VYSFDLFANSLNSIDKKCDLNVLEMFALA